MAWLERVIHWLEKKEHPRKGKKMSYVPVQLWVPDTQEGVVTDAVKLKPCDTCRALVPNEFMDEHQTAAHPPPPEVTPH